MRLPRTRHRCRSLSFGLVLLLLVGAVPLAADTVVIPDEIQTVVSASRYRHAWWGLLAQDAQTGRILCAWNADLLFHPASVTKLFSAAAALEQLGGDYRFRTPLYINGNLDSRGVVRGDLILVASGDITMGGRTRPDGRIAYSGIEQSAVGDKSGVQNAPAKTNPLAGIRRLARQATSAGIKAVTGEVIVDDRLFPTSSVYSVKNPGTVIFHRSPMMINDNLFDIVISPARRGMPAAVDWRPRLLPLMRVISKVRTVAPDQPPHLEVIPSGFGKFLISGEIPEGHPPVVRETAIPDAASYGRALLIDALRMEGIKMKASPAAPNPFRRIPQPEAYPRFVKVAELVSPPLTEYLRMILKDSHNPGAEIIPHLLALQAGGNSFAEGMQRQKLLLSRFSADPGSISLADGSGLSQANLVTPRAVVALLAHMTRQRHGLFFREALPLLGVDGTLMRSGRDSPARGRISGKTGTLITVDLLHDSAIMDGKSLAGYMMTAAGREVAFAFFVNFVHSTDVRGREETRKFTGEIGADLLRIAEAIHLAN